MGRLMGRLAQSLGQPVLSVLQGLPLLLLSRPLLPLLLLLSLTAPAARADVFSVDVFTHGEHPLCTCLRIPSYQPSNLKSDDDDERVLELVPEQRQLFVDELHIRSKRGIVTEFHRAQKKGAVIRDYGFDNMTGSVSRRRDCHFADILSPSLLKRLLKGEGMSAK